MKPNNIVFVNPAYPQSRWKRNTSPPIGIGYLMEIVNSCGAEAFLYDLSLGGEEAGLFNFIREKSPDLAAFSLMTFQYKNHYKIIARLKDKFPELRIITGGPHIQIFGKKVLEECPGIEAAFECEGELSLKEFISGAGREKIAGIIFRENEKIIHNPFNKFIDDLDQIPFPKYPNVDLSRYQRISISTSRGCPYLCTFCQSTNLGKKWRFRSPENVYAELRYWYEKGYKNFVFVDDNFNFNRERVVKICRLIIDNGLTDLKLNASGVRADLLDRELLIIMKAAGFYAFGIGVESASPQVLKNLKKAEKIEKIEDTVKTAVELGFNVVLYFLIGAPNEKIEDVKLSIEFAKKYNVAGVFFSNIMPVPGTELFDWIKETGRFVMDYEDYLNAFAEFEDLPLFEAPGMNLAERKKMLRITHKLMYEVEINQKKNEYRKILKKYGLPEFLAVFLIKIPYKLLSALRKLYENIIRK